MIHLKDAVGMANSVEPDQGQSGLGLRCFSLLRLTCPDSYNFMVLPDVSVMSLNLCTQKG